MSMEDHLKNRIFDVPDDQLVARAIVTAIELLENENLGYAVLGSCGLQAYFDCCFRLPNDLDIVLPFYEVDVLERVAAARGFRFIKEFGRVKIWIDGFPIHLIPYQMNIVDKKTDTIFTTLDLEPHVRKAKYLDLFLVNSDVIPRMKVLSIEVIFLVELLRSIYIGSLMSVFFVMKFLQLDERIFVDLLRENELLRPIVEARLLQYPAKLDQMTIFDESERGLVIQRLERFTNQIHKLL